MIILFMLGCGAVLGVQLCLLALADSAEFYDMMPRHMHDDIPHMRRGLMQFIAVQAVLFSIALAYMLLR